MIVEWQHNPFVCVAVIDHRGLVWVNYLVFAEIVIKMCSSQLSHLLPSNLLADSASGQGLVDPSSPGIPRLLLPGLNINLRRIAKEGHFRHFQTRKRKKSQTRNQTNSQSRRPNQKPNQKIKPEAKTEDQTRSQTRRSNQKSKPEAKAEDQARSKTRIPNQKQNQKIKPKAKAEDQTRSKTRSPNQKQNQKTKSEAKLEAQIRNKDRRSNKKSNYKTKAEHQTRIIVVVNHWFTSLFGTKGLLSDIIIR